MKKIKLILGVAFVILQSCSSNEKKQEAPKTISMENAKLPEKIKDKAYQDSFISIEESRAFGEILFGISDYEFEKLKKKVLEKCVSDEHYYNCKLGDYTFNKSAFEGYFHNDSLYSIIITGNNYDNGYIEVAYKQLEALMTLLISKYGKPNTSKDITNWATIENGQSIVCANWRIGKKEIDVFISSSILGASYSVNLKIFIPEIEYKMIKELDEWHNKLEEERKQVVEKAKDLL